MHRSVYEKLRRQIEKRGSGTVFVTHEFLELGSRAALDAACMTIPAFILR